MVFVYDTSLQNASHLLAQVFNNRNSIFSGVDKLTACRILRLINCYSSQLLALSVCYNHTLGNMLSNNVTPTIRLDKIAQFSNNTRKNK